MVLPDSRGIPRVPRYSGTCPASQPIFAYRALTVCGRPFQVVRLTGWFVTRRPRGLTGPTTPACKHTGLGCSAFARRYLRNHYCFLFLQVLRWFTSLRCPHSTYVFSRGYPGITPGGFPHSEIFGSTPVCGSPKLIAAYRVLHRLLAPRHPPYALSSLTILGHRRIPGIRRPRRRISEIAPMPKHCVITESYRLWSIQLSNISRGSRPAPGAPSCHAPADNLVENTGLEPVTSWLQTRRSPS